ncbi:MAG: hypothetical protein GX371_04300 [Bacteroidales bacterium]|nr:hypothetical protein [Bacteroidales bacterium]
MPCRSVKKETIQKDVPEAIFTLPQVLSSVGDYTQSLEYISLAEKEKYTMDNPVFYSEISRMQGRLLSLLGLHQSAIRVFKKGIDQIQRGKSDETLYLLSMAYDNLSGVHILLNESDSAIYYLEMNRELLNNADEFSSTGT